MRASVFGCLAVAVALGIARPARAQAPPPWDAAEPAELAGRPLLVVAYDPAILPDLNMGGAVPVDSVMGFVGETRREADAARMLEMGDEPTEWERRLEWLSDDSAHALIRDTARALDIEPGHTYWVLANDGPVRVTIVRARAGRNTCGRPGGIAVTLQLHGEPLPPGVYYAAPDSVAAARARVLPSAAWPAAAPDSVGTALDADSDGAADTFLLPETLVQRRTGGRVYIALHPGIGRC
ncbi:MAG: hypothetical protein ACN0LA_08720 [Candidatus Longimicrobiales bacterium M2_2A_002]